MAQSAPLGSVAWYQVGRTALNPANGTGFAYGYYTQIAGINSLPFSGTPSEKTAVFTFRTSVFQLVPLPANGDITLSVALPDTFNIYLNASPAGDWTNPDTFSSGQIVATYSRTQFLLSIFATSGTGTEYAVLTSSQKYSFNGATVDFASIIPAATITSSYSPTIFPGVASFPVGLAFSGQSIAAAAIPTQQAAVTFTATPNPIPASGSSVGSTTLAWNAPAAQIIEIHVGSPAGALFTHNNNTGSVTTGNWVTDGMTFYLQDVSNGLPLTAANTLATLTIHLK